MQTPNTPRGRETERLMLLWRKQNPDADPSAYNRKWDSVYQALKDEFSDKEIVEMASMNLDALCLEESDRRLIEPRYVLTKEGFKPVVVAAHSSPAKTLRSRESERAAKRRAGTKGAFGKPKTKHRR
jgi:hypothetical protein